MIWALLAAAIVAATQGGGQRDSFEEIIKFWRKAVARDIEDPALRAQMAELLGRFEAAVGRLTETVQRRVGELGPIHARYESTAEDYRALLDLFGPELMASQLEIVDITLEARELLGPRYDEINAKVRRQLVRKRQRSDRRDARKDARNGEDG